MLLMACLFIGIGLVNAQKRVTGNVTSSEDGLPVVGASIMVKGTTIGTVTDLDGNFTLGNVPQTATKIQISFVGMKTVLLDIKSKLIVELHPDNEILDEVMVVAYGTAKKSSFTGSATVVKSEEIGKIQTSNAANALTGKVSGVQLNTASGQPGQTTPSIRVRGISSINAGSAPLVILDGAPYDGDLNNINTQDIESMTVLKDAASNALYGARGANGVIMITTKKGKSGDAIVTLDAKWGVNTRATQDYNFITSPAQYYEMYFGALQRDFISDGMSAEEAYVKANSAMLGGGDYGLGYNVYTIPEGQYLIGTNGKLNPNATLGNIVTYKGQQYTLRPDSWIDEAYKNSLRQEYNMSVTGGTDKSSFYASVNYLDNEGITVKSNYKRLTGRLKSEFQAKPWLKVGANMSYTHYDSNSLSDDGSSGSSGNIFAAATQIAPIYPFFMRDGEGNIMKDSNGFIRYDYGDQTNAGLTRPILSGSNAYSTTLLNLSNMEGNAMTASGFFEVRFLKDFKFTWNSGVNIDESRSSDVTNPYYGQYASSNGIVYKGHGRSLSYNHQQLLNYNHEFGKHNVSLMVGHESYFSKYYSLSGNKSNMFDPSNSELIGAIVDGSSNSYTSNYNTEGYFGRIQYDFDGKYFGSASYRRDASSRFHPDNRWGNFWSAGVAWLINKEEFLDVDWVDMLKLKASYGSQGNDNIGNNRYVSTYEIVNSSGRPAAVPQALGNKDITWETNGNFNAGVDFELWNNRVTGTFEYFYRKTTDMLFSFPLPPSYGYTSYYANVGDMRNQGVEFELNVTPIKTRDFVWDIRLNMTHYKNKVTYLPEERKTMEVDGVKGYTSGDLFFGEGISLYTYHLKKYAGVDQNGEALYYKNIKDDNGKVTGRETTTKYAEADYYLCDTALPDVYGGFGTSFSYKGFDFSADFIYQIGGQVYDGDYAGMMTSPTASNKGRNFHADLLKAWTPENPNSNIPRLQFGDKFTASHSDRFLTNASYLGFQNVNLGYTLPAKFTRTFGISKLRVYMAADNICVWSKRQGLDPRQSITGSVTNSFYAPIRTISGGLTVTF